MASDIYHDPNYNFPLNRIAKYGSCPRAQDIVRHGQHKTHIKSHEGYHCTLPNMVVSPT